MKVLRTIESFFPYVSGPANQAKMISRKLSEHGIESPIFTTFYKAEGCRNEESLEGVQVRRFPIKAAFMKYLYTPGFEAAILDERPDIIHAHNYRSYQTQVASRAAKRMKIPFIVNTHGSLIGYRCITKGLRQMPYKVYDLFGRSAIDHADAVVVSSKQEYTEALAFGVQKEKLHIIPMGIDVTEYDRIEQQRDDKITLLFVGRICRDRNIMPILTAMTRLDRHYELRIVGGAVKRSDAEKDGYYEELVSYAKENRINAVFTGPKYGDDLKKEYRNADIFVYTSLWENFGQCLLEAGAAGLPIISTPVGIAEEIIEDDKAGYIVGFDMLDRLDIFIKRLTGLKKREQFGKKMKKHINDLYNWNHIRIAYEKIYLGLTRDGEQQDTHS